MSVAGKGHMPEHPIWGAGPSAYKVDALPLSHRGAEIGHCAEGVSLRWYTPGQGGVVDDRRRAQGFVTVWPKGRVGPADAPGKRELLCGTSGSPHRVRGVLVFDNRASQQALRRGGLAGDVDRLCGGLTLKGHTRI